MADSLPPPKPPNRYIEALKDEYHLLGWCGLIVGALMADAPSALLLLGPALEAAYLAAVPHSPWFRRRLEQKRVEIEARVRAYHRATLLPTLCRRDRERYADLCQMSQDIARHHDPVLERHQQEVDAQLEYLLDRFLVFAAKSQLLRSHLSRLAEGPRHVLEGEEAIAARDLGEMESRAVERFERDLETVAADLERETDRESLAILRKHAEILRRSRASVEEMARLIRNLERQMALLENTFTLIQTQTKQGAPDQVLEDVTALVNQSDALAQAIQEFAPVEQALVRLGTGRR
ncbi:MAG: hypothetical protein HY320_15830 [Armatimonadetes bacterium]|nr:hypothetical protein [Armatimonadota bacterium]